MKCYIIYDTVEKVQWIRGSKGAWLKPAYAKNSFMVGHSSTTYDKACKLIGKLHLTEDWKKNKDTYERRYMSFKDQTRYECWECDLTFIQKK